MEIDIDALFRKVISKNKPEPPKTFQVCLDEAELKELFEFLLDFMTMLCKYYYADDNGIVNLNQMSLDDFNLINNFMKSFGFECIFDKKEANYTNCIYYSQLQYNRVTIHEHSKLDDLLFSIKCDSNLFIVKFRNI